MGSDFGTFGYKKRFGHGRRWHWIDIAVVVSIAAILLGIVMSVIANYNRYGVLGDDRTLCAQGEREACQRCAAWGDETCTRLLAGMYAGGAKGAGQ